MVNKNSCVSWLNQIIPTLAVAIVASLVTGCGDEKKEAQVAPLSKVVVVEAKMISVPISGTFSGTLTAKETVEVRARVSGYVDKKFFNDGDQLKAGEVMYQLDDRDLKAILDTAKANTAKAKAAWTDADIIKDRMVILGEKGSISLQQKDSAVAKAAEALAAYQAAQAEEEQATVNLGYATIAAPTDGYVSRSNVEVGSVVDAGSATLLTTIYKIDPIRAEFSVTDTEYSKFMVTAEKGKGQSEHLTFSMVIGTGNPPYAYPGVLEMVDPIINPTTNTMGVRVEFPNPKKLLRPGMFVNITGTVGDGELLSVPNVAVLDQVNAKVVYVVNDKNIMEVVPVTVGELVGSNRVILSGLTAGQRVVVKGLVTARPGAEVEAVLQAAPAVAAPAAAAATEADKADKLTPAAAPAAPEAKVEANKTETK